MGMPITEELIFELMNKKIWALVEKSRLIYCRLPYPPFHHQKKEERWSVACLVFSSVRYKASLPSFWAAKLNPMMWTQEFHARICRLITSNYCSFLLFKVEPPKKKNQPESLLDPLDGASSPFRAYLPGETQAGHQEITMGAPRQPLLCTGALRARAFAP